MFAAGNIPFVPRSTAAISEDHKQELLDRIERLRSVELQGFKAKAGSVRDVYGVGIGAPIRDTSLKELSEGASNRLDKKFNQNTNIPSFEEFLKGATFK